MQTVSATFLGFPAATMRASKRKLASSIGYNHFLKVKIGAYFVNNTKNPAGKYLTQNTKRSFSVNLKQIKYTQRMLKTRQNAIKKVQNKA
ncbi:hypothetical protein P9363_23975 [Escherichia coli]|uniref:hypothetical protein n=1 Tax=Escherichia coli TaxID=562 RepID=UPI003891DF45